MNLSIVIVSYKSLTNLENCLKHLGNKREILIVENSNSHSLKQTIENNYKNCKVILNKENFGFGKASNIGIEKVNSKYVLLLSTDIVIEESQITLIENEILKLNNSFALASPLSDDLIDFVKNNSFDKFLKNTSIDDNNEDTIKVDLVKGCSLIINLDSVVFFDIIDSYSNFPPSKPSIKLKFLMNGLARSEIT